MLPLALLAMVTCLVFTLLYVVYKPPSVLIRYLQRRWPDVLFRRDHVKHKVIALTIDDGPSQYTEEILQVLKANDANATFFVIGSHIPGHEEVLCRLIHAGNELANHAMYDEPSVKLSNAELVSQIESVKRNLSDIYSNAGIDSGPPHHYFRPGSGFFSSRLRRTIRDLGYRLVLGNVYPHDPQIPFPRLNARHILSMVSPGAVIICHDGRKWTPPMLRQVLPELKRRGYDVVTVTDLLNA